MTMTNTCGAARCGASVGETSAAEVGDDVGLEDGDDVGLACPWTLGWGWLFPPQAAIVATSTVPATNLASDRWMPIV
jgi:hypothetical protein